MLGTIGRVGDVLRLFNDTKPEWGVTEIADHLGIPKSTAHDVLKSLADVGLVRHTESNRYRLGWNLLSLSQILLATTEFRDRGLEVMRGLVDDLGETVNLGVLDGSDVVYLEKLQGTRSVQIGLSGIGRRVAAHCTGLGKMILSDLNSERLAGTFPVPDALQTFTPNSIGRLVDLRVELAQIARQGYAYDHEEAASEICCVAAPIRDSTMRVVAAFSVSMPAYRFAREQERYTARILEAAESMSPSGVLELTALPAGSISAGPAEMTL